ncbi:NAD(P)/FAD-dependent oxidoreductase [Clostridium sp. DJ247]|uniref:NAD(P)/FAD-dependent oxidoreductase n=1 Tax=Clostridium sp. DJ247 TaxID=2726188 RepID=UPI001625ECA1|nr:FAD-dependent oxidoreductase [Clostridium sp. DJ247]MBC2580415.1 FAD-dependent oxidoreductase [Clostridium sp. DJ247]
MKIFIVGGGFAGIKAARELSKKLSDSHEIYLIDKKEYTTMLPNLPEITSGRLESKDITEKIINLIPSSVKFINEEIDEIDFDQREISIKNKKYSYDYLIFASGSTTNFYGFDQNLDKVNVVDSLEAAEKIKAKFTEYISKTLEATLVVSGAGFTGMELACNLYDLCKRKHKKLNVIFVERANTILPMLSKKLSSHALDKLKKLNFKIYTDNQVIAFDGENITLKNDETIKNAFFCWCSGVKSTLKPIGKYKSLPDGRIIVDEFLAIPEYQEVYAVGDAAAIKDKNNTFLRRAVTFAQESGKQAAINIAAEIKNQERKVFKPLDLGWIIPIYISSIGQVLNKDIKGRKGIFMHYILCGLKNYSLRNFWRELKAAFKYTFAKP